MQQGEQPATYYVDQCSFKNMAIVNMIEIRCLANQVK